MTCIRLIRTRPGRVVLAVDDEVVSGEILETIGELLLTVVVAVLEKLPEFECCKRMHGPHATRDLHAMRDSPDLHGDSQGARRARS